MQNKVEILETFLPKSPPDTFSVICLSEHWLRDSTTNLACPNGFYCATDFCRVKNIRGGTCVFIDKKYQSSKINVSNFSSELNFEVSAAAIENLKLIIVSIYHSPAGDPNIFLKTLDQFLCFISTYKGFSVIVGGDINASFDVTSSKGSAMEFLNILRQYNYFCINDKPTRGNNCLDNIFLNCPKDVKSCNIFDFPFSDHNGLALKIHKNVNPEIISPTSQNTSLVISLPKTAIEDLASSLSSYDWNSLINNRNVLNAQDFFGSFLAVIVNKLTFLSTLKRKSSLRKNKKSHKWYSRELAQMKERLIFLDKLVKTSNCDRLNQNYRNLKTIYKRSIVDARLAFNAKIVENSSNKCKAAWHLIKENTNNTSSSQIVDLTPDQFNHYFTNSIQEIKNCIKKPNVDCLSLLSNYSIKRTPFKFTQISPEDITKAVKKLKNSESKDVFNLSNNMIKKICYSFLSPLTVCINKCLTEGIFPDELKLSRICPIFKKGPKNKPDSYRPISVIPVFSKIIEIIVYNQLILHLENNNYLSLSQFGFRKGRCTFDAIDSLIKEILDGFEKRYYGQATLFDLRKAFDCVDHNKIVSKLKFYGVSGVALSFFVSYLSNRRQKVYLNGNWSKEVGVPYGVPQGSVLGPLLFLILINDLPNSIRAKSFIYVDDSTFFNIHSNFDSLQNCVNETILEASTWFQSNGLLLNEEKTQNILFSLRKAPLDLGTNNYLPSVKFLGIFIDKDLSWHTHIEYISKRLSRVIFLLRRILNCVPESYIKSAYYAFFQSIVRYGLVIWGNSNKINDILILQKKAVRVLSKAHPLEHCKPLFKKLGFLTVINLYIFDCIIYILHNVPSYTLSSELHNHDTRSKNSITIEHCRLTKTHRSHIITAKKIYNKVQHLIERYPGREFRKKLNNWLLDNPFYDLSEFFDMECVHF